MAEKFIPCINPYDNLALLAEILRTLRLIAGLEPGEYDASKGGLTMPDDLDAKKVKKDTKAEEKKTKAEKKKAEAEEKKARVEADAIAKEAKEATAEKELKVK